MFNVLFPTLFSKTFILLSGALFLCYVGAYSVIFYFKRALASAAPYVTAKQNQYGEEDLEVDRSIINTLFWPAIILNILAFVILMYAQTFSTSLIMYALFALTDGITIGVVLLVRDENIGKKVLLLTAFATIIAGVIGYNTQTDLIFLSNFLFFGLLGLLVVTISRFFIHVGGWPRTIIASFGILLFIGYLLYDFNQLKKVSRGVEALNNWTNALQFSTNIYLDIINLFLQILDLLSDDN